MNRLTPPCEFIDPALHRVLPPPARKTGAKTRPVAIYPITRTARAFSDHASEGDQGFATLDEFWEASKIAKRYLPKSLQASPVTDALSGILQKTIAQATLDAAYSQNRISAIEWTSEEKRLDSHHVSMRLTHAAVRTYTNRFFSEALRPGIAVVLQPDNPASNPDPFLQVFAKYFTAYYKGEFIDRMGSSIQRPDWKSWINAVSGNIAIPDADINAAETVLLEFFMDLFDATPILGNTDHLQDATNFYPGGSNEPTTLRLGRTGYRKIGTNCGITENVVNTLVYVANAASDRASAIGGVSFNTPGGLVLLGKISLGDNQTLSLLAKTAVSRVALRITYAAGYWTIQTPPSYPCMPTEGAR